MTFTRMFLLLTILWCSTIVCQSNDAFVNALANKIKKNGISGLLVRIFTDYCD